MFYYSKSLQGFSSLGARLLSSGQVKITILRFQMSRRLAASLQKNVGTIVKKQQTLNVRKFKMTLNPLRRILQKVAFYHAHYNSIIQNGGHRAWFGVISA